MLWETISMHCQKTKRWYGTMVRWNRNSLNLSGHDTLLSWKCYTNQTKHDFWVLGALLGTMCDEKLQKSQLIWGGLQTALQL